MCVCITLVPLAFASFSYTYSAARSAGEQRARFGGLDPAHNRNIAMFRLAEEIHAGRLARTVLVDQHAYFDLRYLVAQGIKVRYLNIFNF